MSFRFAKPYAQVCIIYKGFVRPQVCKANRQLGNAAALKATTVQYGRGMQLANELK